MSWFSDGQSRMSVVHVLKWRWLLSGFISALVITGEVFDLAVSPADAIDLAFFYELTVFAVIVPVAGAIGLGMLSHAVRAGYFIDLQERLIRLMSGAQDWDELALILVRFPHAILPIVQANLLLYDPMSRRFRCAAAWHERDVVRLMPLQSKSADRQPPAPSPSSPQANKPCSDVALDASPSVYCSHPLEGSAGTVAPCCQAGNGGLELYNSFCLPLVKNQQTIALLRLYIRRGITLTDEETRPLADLSPAMALAVAAYRPQHALSTLAVGTENVRHMISQDLHDSLGPELAYLRLRLDKLIDSASVTMTPEGHQQLVQLRDIASEANDQVRNTLLRLRQDATLSLPALLFADARAIGEHANLKVQCTSEGTPGTLSAAVERQIQYIVHEALTNVAKHAKATRVDLSLAWSSQRLTVQVADDGRGFKPGAIQKPDHFGLVIMHERATDIHARLTIASQPHQGTRLILEVPLNPPEQPWRAESPQEPTPSPVIQG